MFPSLLQYTVEPRSRLQNGDRVHGVALGVQLELGASDMEIAEEQNGPRGLGRLPPWRESHPAYTAACGHPRHV